MELLPLAFTSGWTSGINAYATVLILGLLGRFAGDLALAFGATGGVTLAGSVAGRIAPVSREMILNFIAQHVLGQEKSY